MVDARLLKLTALDKEDLTVISACLQDAVVRGSDLLYQPRRNRFVAIFNRFLWEDKFQQDSAPEEARRVRTGIHFNSVLSVKSRGIGKDSNIILELLAIEAEENDDGATEIHLEFAAGASIRLEVECIDCYFSDIGDSWEARRTPSHPSEYESHE